jgi:hypothetical protein
LEIASLECDHPIIEKRIKHFLIICIGQATQNLIDNTPHERDSLFSDLAIGFIEEVKDWQGYRERIGWVVESGYNRSGKAKGINILRNRVIFNLSHKGELVVTGMVFNSESFLAA